jgi:hypothetical protein
MAILEKKWAQWVLGILLLGFLVYMVWALVEADPKISTPVIGGMFTVFGGVIVVVITQRSTKQREIDEAHREKKVEMYQGFVEVMERVLLSHNPRMQVEAIPDDELMTYMSRFGTNILLWGSPPVLRAFRNFARSQGIGVDIFVAVDNLYRAIREDLGLSNKGLPPLFLVKMSISDPESIDGQSH